MPEPTTDERLQTPPLLTSKTAKTYLGPATVVTLDGNRTLVRLEDEPRQEVTVTPAFTFPYELTAGDVVLVLGQAGAHYAVGVLSGSKPQSLIFPGNADVRTIDGKLTLASDQAIELRAPKVTVHTGVMRTIANQVVEKADHFRRWVRGTLVLRAGKSRRIIDGEDSTRCENSTTLAKDTVKIDGD